MKCVRAMNIFKTELMKLLEKDVCVVRLMMLIWGLLLFFPFRLLSAPVDDGGGETKPFLQKTESTLENFILTNLLENVSHHAGTVEAYKAQMYVRGQYHVHSRNALIRLVPDMFRFYKQVSDYVTESVIDFNYTAPDIYDMKMRALTGTFRRNQSEMRNTLDFFTLNIYSPTLLPNMLLSPLEIDARAHYSYHLDSLSGDADSLKYHIRIVPRRNSTQLLRGTMVVNDGTWTIDCLTLSGRVELIDFSVRIQMGTKGGEVFLPKQIEMSTMFRFLWNKIEGQYVAHLDYGDIILAEESSDTLPVANRGGVGGDEYDLTSAYRLRLDESEMTDDTAFVADRRVVPLTSDQQQMYADNELRKELSEQNTPIREQKHRVFWGNVGDALVNSHTFSLWGRGHFRFSPLIDLGMFSYGHSNGFSYKQKFNYTRLYSHDRWLRLQPMLGYNFTRKEFYWNLDMDFFYAPQRLGAFTIRVGNGNRIYTSRVMDELRQQKDSLIDFSRLHLEYFEDTYVQVGNRIELLNGLQLLTSLDMHWRRAMNTSEWTVGDAPTIRLRPTYVSFAPRVKLSWTPGQYFYMDGRRKVYLHSHFPTFSLDYERGLDGVLGSDGSFERIEADVLQRIHLTGISNLYYRYGGGVFTDRRSVYFIDFANFARNNLPMGWSDDISGSFHLLDNDWYNSSRWYARAHITYESPFIILPHSRKFTGFVHSERIYLSTLYTTHLHPYIEFGYGVGTYLFNLGIFASNVNGKFHELGCKFTFELFNGQ